MAREPHETASMALVRCFGIELSKLDPIVKHTVGIEIHECLSRMARTGRRCILTAPISAMDYIAPKIITLRNVIAAARKIRSRYRRAAMKISP